VGNFLTWKQRRNYCCCW